MQTDADSDALTLDFAIRNAPNPSVARAIAQAAGLTRTDSGRDSEAEAERKRRGADAWLCCNQHYQGGQ